MSIKDWNYISNKFDFNLIDINAIKYSEISKYNFPAGSSNIRVHWRINIESY